jgi:hypothetical protein
MTRLIFICLLLMIPSIAWGIEIPRWQPHDFTFSSNSKTDNPFQIQFRATISGPGGAQLNLPGFFDGNGTWKLRVSASQPGPWHITTHSDLTNLNNQQIDFVCIPNPDPNIHGGLRIDPNHPRHFLFEDGTHCFLMGYECAWL